MNKNSKMWLIVILSAIVITFVFKQSAVGCGCVVTEIPGDWECDSWGMGWVTDSGTLSKTSDTICVGQGVTPPTASGTSFSFGSKKRVIQYTCGQRWIWDYDDFTYTPSDVYFAPPIPGTFANCGRYSFTAKVEGIPDGPCTYRLTNYVGTFNVTVVAVTDLSPSEGTLIRNSDPPTYRVCPCNGEVTVTASSCPSLTADQLPACWTFEGGTETDKLTHKVSKASLLNGPVTLRVTCGTSSKTIVVKADTEPAPLWDAFYLQECPCPSDLPVNSVLLGYQPDTCGNMLQVWCEKPSGADNARYVYKYNGTDVGHCRYPYGSNYFWYKFTETGCRFRKTWHLTCFPIPPYMPWYKTKYDCFTGVPVEIAGYEIDTVFPGWLTNPNYYE